MTFDKVSKKKATDCTPESAKVEIGITKEVDAFTKKDIVTSSDSAYDPEHDDDVHRCDDAKPTVSITTTASGTVSVTYTHGTHTLQSVEISSGGSVIASKQVSENGTWTLSSSELASASGTLSAVVTDSAYYTASNSATYKKPDSSSST